MNCIACPIKSQNDKKSYRVVELSNGLRALLISDPLTPEDLKACGTKESDSGHVSAEEASESEDQEEDEAMEEGDIDEEEEDGPKEKMAAAALCIKVGSFSDPIELQGLAHYLEHMVFMGSEKYPDENSFSAFMKKRSGSENAFTDCERTVFKLEIHPKHFHEALDRLAQFFIAPLMKKDSMDRELEAVDSEFNLSLPHDSCRKLLLLGSLSKEGNPMGSFLWGNSNSLKKQPESKGIDVYKRLRDFWTRYYSSHSMTLAVQSTETLDVLEQWVREHYSAIPNNELPPPSFEEHKEPFNTPHFHKFYKLCPLKKTHTIYLHWALPSQLEHYKCKPLHYLSHLVGHEGKGSVLTLLRKRGWAVSLDSGNDESGTDHNSIYAAFSIRIVLTDIGMDHLYEVLTLVFQYMELLRKEGPQKWHFEEMKMLAENEFRFQDESEAQDYVESLCESMQLYPPEHYITGGKLTYEYNPDVIDSCAQAMTADAANFMVMSTRYVTEGLCPLKEKWTQMAYSVEDVPVEWLDSWKEIGINPELHLPLPNVYIATDFDIKPPLEQSSEYPVKIFESESCRLYYKKDNKFNVPKGCLNFNLITPLPSSSPQSEVLTDLLGEVLDQRLSIEAYPARLASLSYHVHRHEYGIAIKLDGLGHKLPNLLETILDHIANLEVEPEVFEGLKEQLLKTYYNYFNSPSNVCRDIRLSLLVQPCWTAIDKRAVLPGITLPMVLAYSKQLLSNIVVEGLIQGNLLPQEAINHIQLVISKLKCSALPRNLITDVRVVEIPVGEFAVRAATFNREDSNSIVTNFYQGKPGDIHYQTLMELLCECMEEPCFDVLRTKEQLGYDVSVTMRNTFGIIGLSITVHSSADKFSCTHVEQRIESFFQDFINSITNMKKDEFDMQILSLIRLKLCEDLKLKEESNRNWGEVTSFEYVFDRLQLQVNDLKGLTLEQFQTWVAEEICANRRKLSVQVVGCGQVGKDDCLCYPDLLSPSDTIGGIRPYFYHFLQPKKQPENKIKFLNDIHSFKQSLRLYPVTKICN